VVSVSVDVGGTFTDFVVLDNDGNLTSFKILSTPSRPDDAMLDGLEKINRPVEAILHATTIATNALLGQVGLELPKVVLLVTKGFRDVVEIARQNRSTLYDLFFEKPRELVPRSLRYELDERVDFSGNILKPPDLVELKAVASEMPAVPSVAISFLHSYANNANERKAKEVLQKRFMYVSASYDVAPEPREYERTSTVLLNAVLMPIVAKYLQSVENRLSSFGKPSLHIMASSGGLIDSIEAVSRPVQMIESGPAAGLIASSEFARMLKLPHVISFDMGGTTAKTGTVVNYQPEIISEYEVGGRSHHGRVLKGSGYPVRFPFADLAEVSAGGGTIIWRDEAKALHVGPISAGAEPGPISYRKGGTQPTLTDANLVLGRLSPSLLGGGMTLDIKGANSGFSKIGDTLEVASSAIKLANLEMARAIRLVTVERGLDPSEFNLIVFGGAGPQHAAEVADELGVSRVIIPPEPGAFSALGMLLADSKFEARSSFPKEIEEGFVALESKLAKQAKGATYFTRYADVRYADQGWEVLVPSGKPAAISEIAKLFEEKHQALYGFVLDKPVEVVTIRVFAITPRLKARFKTVPRHGETKAKGSSQVYFGEWIEVPVYHREDLSAEFKAEGPLRIEEYGSCTLVPPSWRISVTELGALLMER
jgi:N-methylhydantoinase A